MSRSVKSQTKYKFFRAFMKDERLVHRSHFLSKIKMHAAKTITLLLKALDPDMPTTVIGKNTVFVTHAEAGALQPD
jgi:hypothetical protein